MTRPPAPNRARPILPSIMDVTFRRTGQRRYAVIVERAGSPAQTMEPAPGYDEHIPHDLVHYVVEAELHLTAGVFGRAATGGGTFISNQSDAGSPRERARARRKQARREATLHRADESRTSDMLTSERLAGISDLHWRRRHGQTPDPTRQPPPAALTPDDAPRVDRVVTRLDALAPAWNRLPIGGALVFTWPGLVPRVELPAGAPHDP